MVPYTAQTNIANIASLKLLKLSPLGFHSFNDKASSIMTSYFKLPKENNQSRKTVQKLINFIKRNGLIYKNQRFGSLDVPKINNFQKVCELPSYKVANSSNHKQTNNGVYTHH